MDFDLRQWLLILGPIFIVGVLLHGYFRMRSGQNEIKMKLDRSFMSQPGEGHNLDELSMFKAELPNGGARVIETGSNSDVPLLMEPVDMPSVSASRTESSPDAGLLEEAGIDPEQAPHRKIVPADHVPSGSVSSDNAASIDVRADDVRADDVRADDVRVDDDRVDDDRVDDVRVDDVRVDDVRADDVRVDDDRVDDDRVDDVRVDDVRVDDVRVADVRVDDVRAGSVPAHDDAAEELRTEPSPDKAPPARRAESVEEEPALTAQKPEKFVVMYVLALEEPFPGQALVEILLDSGMTFGEMDIFHRYDGPNNAGTQLFSLASAVEPGTFDLSFIDQFSTPGVTLFMRVHELSEPLQVFDAMLSVAAKIAQDLNGEVRDETRSVMTPQTIEHCRQSITEFQFKHSA